ncbi:MAG TPA: MBOAT family O-acyltransferase, partial [Bacteroidia bacterium]|nr:MBOAT family O-acyltransferase [Bacteroidia bacterium]
MPILTGAVWYLRDLSIFGRMLFSSLVFLHLFLPLTLLLTIVMPPRWRNVVLLIASLVFYAWGGVSYSLIMIFSIVFNYCLALAIGNTEGERKARLWLLFCVAGNLMLLAVMKYSGFAVSNLNSLLHVLHVKPVQFKPILLPAGISFFTFHALSYVVDIYRKECPVQKNPVRLALYISFFPQLIAGPIIRYHDIASQLTDRKMTLEDFTAGTERFIIGLAKKVLFSNMFALPANEIFATPISGLDASLAWFGAFCYAMHIYCDFSGYSDMALGLGRMFGFHFPENFNFPYLARSIKEFWRRWHISLSTWFRDYVYVPLGGNRKGAARTYMNLMLVFFLTGLWHGASWNFVIWGFLHGFFLILERLFLGKWLERLPGLNLCYTLFVVLNAWVFFNAKDLHYALNYIRMMYHAIPPGIVTKNYLFYLNPEFRILSVIALLGAAGIFEKIKT